MDATTQGSSDAKIVIQQDKTKGAGADQAYQTLMKEYQAYQTSPGVTSTDVATYWASATTELTKAGVLPDVSAAWADEQLKQSTPEARLIKGFGGFTKDGLSNFVLITKPDTDPSYGRSFEQAWLADDTFAQ